MLNVTLVGGKQLSMRLVSIPDKVRFALAKRIAKLALMVQRRVVRDKLLGQVLNVRTGALRRSIAWEMLNDSRAEVSARVFSSGDVKYAAIHEFGGVITQTRSAITGGGVTYRDTVINMPERSFMRSSLTDMQERIQFELRAAVIEGMLEGLKG